MKTKKRRRANTNPIEEANRKSDEEFVACYIEPHPPGTLPWVSHWVHPLTEEVYHLSFARSTSLSEADLEACFRLIEETSRVDYENSTTKWRPQSKRSEMKSEDLRYIVVKDALGSVRAFTSLMPTYEAGQPVIYCYEIHLKADLCGTGLGALLLGFHSIVAYNLPPISKVMLTCFLANARALRFYRKQGFDIDDLSPKARTLRDKTVPPDYTILSQTVVRSEDGSTPT